MAMLYYTFHLNWFAINSSPSNRVFPAQLNSIKIKVSENLQFFFTHLKASKQLRKKERNLTISFQVYLVEREQTKK